MEVGRLISSDYRFGREFMNSRGYAARSAIDLVPHVEPVTILFAKSGFEVGTRRIARRAATFDSRHGCKRT